MIDFFKCVCGCGSLQAVRIEPEFGYDFWISQGKRDEVFVHDNHIKRRSRVLNQLRTIAAAKKWTREEIERQNRVKP